jgi:hypothetical protein
VRVHLHAACRGVLFHSESVRHVVAAAVTDNREGRRIRRVSLAA